jgi:dipeptidyl aminopeptidase/acylaminoacyl peptidase
MRCVCLLVAAASWCAAQRPWTAADTLGFQTIGEVRPSLDGKTIFFTVESADLVNNRNNSRLLRIAASGGEPEPVKGAPEGASSIRWSPDGTRIACIASGGIWVLDVAAAKATRIAGYARSNSFLSKSGNMLAWSPDGRDIAFAGTLEPTPPPEDPIVVTRILYKGRTALADNRRTHIYVVPATGGEPRPLTKGNYDEHSIDWGGDGGEIVFLSNHEPDPDAKLNYDIFAVNVKSGAVRQITRTPGVEMEPRISPDGRSVAYIATRRELTTIDSVAEDAHAWVVPVAGGQGREVNRDLDRRTGAVEFSGDMKWLVYTAGDRGSNMICVTVLDESRSACEIGRGAQVGSLAVSRDGSAAFTMSTPGSPAELYRLDPNSGTPRQLTRLNAALARQLPLSKPETLEFKSFDGTPVQGWLYPARNARGRTPMILSIHGGPHGAHGFGFNPVYQFYASKGYSVLAINPRGSSGYGQKFSDGCVNDWGGGDYKDLMAGVDHALATHTNLDPAKLFVTGSSYGGFMTNWVITQTKRFRAAVAGASLSNLISFYATSLYQDLVHAEFGGFPWAGKNFETLWKWSPLAHVASVTTPTMFVHGESDNDVHITQAEEMYTALRYRGVPAELVRYPREGHGFREPKHRLDSVSRTLEWFERYSR